MIKNKWRLLTNLVALLLIVVALIAVKVAYVPLSIPEQYISYPAQPSSLTNENICAYDLDQSGIIDTGDLSASINLKSEEQINMKVAILEHWGESCRP